MGRFSLEKEEIDGMPGYWIVLLDRVDQVGLEDSPGRMILDASDEQLLENCELEPDDAAHVQESLPSVRAWLEAQGWEIARED